jgi:hypothetical protein
MQREHDQDDAPLSPAQRELEAALRSLSPAPREVDAIAAAYEAGRRSMRWRLHAWQSAAALVLIALGATWITSSLPSDERAMPAPIAAGPRVLVLKTTAPVAQPNQATLLMLERAVSDAGLDGLPASPLPTAPPLRTAEMF